MHSLCQKTRIFPQCHPPFSLTHVDFLACSFLLTSVVFAWHPSCFVVYEIGTKFTFSVTIIPSRAGVALASVSDVPVFVKNVTTICAPQSSPDCCVKVLRWPYYRNAITGMQSNHASIRPPTPPTPQDPQMTGPAPCP